ncbi:hypothetical protein IW262DRAFT_894714 [Armillaria fumosa]|nr:hypothetical protein IW262DRAFT_894714 [Armillaria fumosa]
MAPPGNSFLIPCSPSHSTNHLIMFAGSLHGITKDSAFDIFKSDSSRPDLQDVLATLRVTEVQSHVSHLLITPPLTSLFDSPHSKRQYWYARLKKASGPPVLNIYCDDSGILERICTENSESRITVAFDVTENPDEADLCLIVEENDVSFRIGKRLRADIEFPSQFSPYSPFPVNHIADIRNFINRFAHFIFHLMPGGLGPMTDFVCFEMNKLGRNGRNFYRDSVVVLRKVKNGGLAEVVLSEDRYGFTIHNNYDDDLHVYLLYFDASTLEIDIWYSSPMTQNKGSVDAFLKKKSLLVMEKMLMSCTQW